MRSCARNVEVKTVLNQTWPIEGEEDFDGANWKFSHGKKSYKKNCLIDREKIKHVHQRK